MSYKMAFIDAKNVCRNIDEDKENPAKARIKQLQIKKALWNEADSRSSSTASTPKSVRIAPFRNMSAEDSGCFITIETAEKNSGYCNRDNNNNNIAAVADPRSPSDGNSTTAWIDVSGSPGGGMCRRILAINGFFLLLIGGLMLLVIDVMTPSRRLALIGQDCYMAVHVAASYLLSMPYLTLVGSGATICGICGAAGLISTSKVSQMIGGVTLTLLWIYTSLNCLTEFIIGFHGTTRGNMYEKYLATFKTLHYHASLPSTLDLALVEKWNLMVDLDITADSDCYARAIEATSLHFWLCLWFCLVSILMWALGDAYTKVLVGAIDRSNIDEEVGMPTPASTSSLPSGVVTTTTTTTSRPTSLTSTTTTVTTNSGHSQINKF